MKRVRKTMTALLLLTVIVLAGLSLTSAQEDSRRIQFARGKSSATVEGKLKANNQIYYKVGAKAGQKMTVTFHSTAGNDAGLTIFAPNPSGEEKLIWGEDGRGNKTMTFDLEYKGDYEIQVGSTRSCSYTLTVGIK